MAEWNINRYTTPLVTNTPSEATEGYDPDLYPIESIVQPMRPKQGPVKARVGSAVITKRSTLPADPRYVLSSDTDAYKYWASPYLSATSITGAGYAITGVDVRVDYQRAVRINKLLVNFEEHICLPTTAKIYVQTSSGGAWTEAITGGVAVPTNGVLEIYYDSTWSTTVPATTTADIVVYGVRVVS